MIIPVEALRIAYNALKDDIEHLESLMQTQSDNMQDIIRSLINRKKGALSEIKEFCPDVECDFFKTEKETVVYADEIEIHESSEPPKQKGHFVEMPGFRNDLQRCGPLKQNEATPQEIADIIEQLKNTNNDPNLTICTEGHWPLV